MKWPKYKKNTYRHLGFLFEEISVSWRKTNKKRHYLTWRLNFIFRILLIFLRNGIYVKGAVTIASTAHVPQQWTGTSRAQPLLTQGPSVPPCPEISKKPKSADLKNLNKSKSPPIEQHLKKHVIKNWNDWNDVALFLNWFRLHSQLIYYSCGWSQCINRGENWHKMFIA